MIGLYNNGVFKKMSQKVVTILKVIQYLVKNTNTNDRVKLSGFSCDFDMLKFSLFEVRIDTSLKYKVSLKQLK